MGALGGAHLTFKAGQKNCDRQKNREKRHAVHKRWRAVHLEREHTRTRF
jgi:hypothetical protein